MKSNVFLAIGCAFALMFSACGGEENEGGNETPTPITKTFCERMAEKTTWSEFECEETVRKLGVCSDQYKSGMTCLLNLNRPSGNMKQECPGEYMELVDCANKNGGKMSVSTYCNVHKAECGYVTELISTCTEDYSALECAENYAAFMDCALTNTTLECVDYGYSESSYTSAVQDALARYCTLPALAYEACIN